MVRPGSQEKYWNPLLETLPQEKLKQLQFKKFKRILEWAYQNSPFYRTIYREAGLEPGDIRTVEDIKQVPKVDKAMLRTAQGKDPYPYGDILSVPASQVTEYRETSGTTGQPVYHPETWQDWDWSAESWAYILYAHGYRDYDRVFIPFGYSINTAFWAGHYAAEKVGCEVVPGGVLNTEARLLKMKELRATAFMATPTYILGMVDTARKKLGLEPARDLHIKKITAAGEPGASIPSTRKRIEEAWGAKVYDHCGATEIGHWGYECEEQCGLHVNEAFHLVEIEDIATDAAITGPGSRGKMIITTFDRFAHPCVRFDSKDIVEWSPVTQCECGRTFRLLKGGVTGRCDNIIKAKGVLLSPDTIEEVIRSVPQLGDEYEVEVTKKGDIDDITVKVELLPESASETGVVGETLDHALRLKTKLRFNVQFHEYGTLPRYETKARRFKDLRGGDQ
jgi:phenylacetate-CoA ligase